MFIPDYPQFVEGPVYRNPVLWYGNAAPAGASVPWVNAPLGSLYIRITAANVKLFIKTAANSADADWQYANVT